MPGQFGLWNLHLVSGGRHQASISYREMQEVHQEFQNILLALNKPGECLVQGSALKFLELDFRKMRIFLSIIVNPQVRNIFAELTKVSLRSTETMRLKCGNQSASRKNLSRSFARLRLFLLGGAHSHQWQLCHFFSPLNSNRLHTPLKDSRPAIHFSNGMSADMAMPIAANELRTLCVPGCGKVTSPSSLSSLKTAKWLLLSSSRSVARNLFLSPKP